MGTVRHLPATVIVRWKKTRSQTYRPGRRKTFTLPDNCNVDKRQPFTPGSSSLLDPTRIEIPGRIYPRQRHRCDGDDRATTQYTSYRGATEKEVSFNSMDC